MPAIDDGSTCAQIFVGTESLLVDAYGMRTDKQFVNTLEDVIRDRGAMSRLISDSAQAETSKRVTEILRAYQISAWQSEPHHQHQNFAERRYAHLKQMVNTIMDRVCAPAYTWLLCLLYICFILNHTYNASIKAVPLQRATGSTPDISPLLRFRFWEPVYYRVDDSSFPTESRELRGRFVGIAEHIGHMMMLKILTDDTDKVIYRSSVRSALDPATHNLRVDPLGGEPTPFILSHHEVFGPDESVSNDGETNPTNSMPSFDTNDLVGRTFLMGTQEDGQRH
jgi:hypothetical protein